MSAFVRVLSGADARWADRLARSPFSPAALVCIGWLLIAANRLGGLTLTDPRSVVRLAVIGIWGWLGLGVALWIAIAVGAALGERRDGPEVPPLGHVLSVAGWAHISVVVLSMVVFVAAGALELLGPGLVTAAVVFTTVVPFAIVTGVRHLVACSTPRAITIVTAPYVAWLLVVVRPMLDSISHLL